MKDRTILQWETDNLEARELLEVDCLALGTPKCICRMLELVRKHPRSRPRDRDRGCGEFL